MLPWVLGIAQDILKEASLADDLTETNEIVGEGRIENTLKRGWCNECLCARSA